MIVTRAGNSVIIHSPAKLNLFLEIRQRRPDGFHEIETVMRPVGWFDTLRFEPQAAPRLELDCHWKWGIEARRHGHSPHSGGAAYAELPPPEQNLAWRAAQLLREEAGIARGALMQLRKCIPAGAGLGGASANAAAALVAGNLGWQLHWPLERLLELAGQLGSDVPFFLCGTAAVCRGRGEVVEPFSARGIDTFVMVKPAESLSTAAVYKRCRVPEAPRRSDDFAAALRTGANCRRELFFNRMEAAARELSSNLAELPRKLEQIARSRSLMSGSGTCHFVRCRNARHARRVAALARAQGLGAVCCSGAREVGSPRMMSDHYSN